MVLIFYVHIRYTYSECYVTNLFVNIAVIVMTKKKIISLGALIIMTLFGVIVSSPFAFAVPRNIAPGVDYETETITGRGTVMRAIIADTQQTSVLVESKGNTCTSAYNNSDIQNLTNDSNLIAAINANFFNSESRLIQGDFIGNRIYFGLPYSPGNVGIRHDSSVVVGSGSLTDSMISEFSMFIRGIYRIGGTGGKTFTEMTDEDVLTRFRSIYSRDLSNARDPIARSFLGVIPSQHKIILMTGGAGAQRSQGVTPVEGVNFLKRLGATEAFVLDSGGSTLLRLNRVAGESGGMPDGRSIHSIITVRTGRPQTAEQVNALSRLDCRSSTLADAPATTGGATAGTTEAPPSGPIAAGTTTAVSVPLGSVPLEVPIGSVGSISGEGGIIVNYSRVLFAFFAGIVGLLALIMLIVSGLRIITGGADQMTKGKEGIASILSGLILFASSGFLLYLLNPCFFTFGESTACQARITSTGTSTAGLAPTTTGGAGETFTGGAAPGGTATAEGPDVASGSPPSEYRSRLPSVWGNGKKAEGLSRFNDFGVEFIRQSNSIFPGVPPEIIMGFSLNGGRYENTTGFRTGLPAEHRPNPPAGVDCAPILREGQGEFNSASLHQRFHEIGMFGVEGGPRCGPAPGPEGAANSNWTPVAQSSDVQTLLGRPGCTSPGCWYPPGGIPDQIAIGLVNTRNAGRSVMRNLPESIRASSENSLWFISLAFMGWSAGTGRAANHVEAYASELASVPENQRWGAFLRILANGAESGQITCREHSTHACVLYSALRTLQKNEAGLILARERGGNVQFWEDGLGSERVQILDTITRFGNVAGR